MEKYNLLRVDYERWLERTVIPNLRAEGVECEINRELYNIQPKVNEWLGEKGWCLIKGWIQEEWAWSMTSKDDYNYSVYKCIIKPIRKLNE